MTEHAHSPARRVPVRRWLITIGVTALLAAGGVAVVTYGWEGARTGRFVAGAGIALLGMFAVIWRSLGTAGREVGSEPISGATWITLGRGSATVVLAGFLFVERPAGTLAWIPGLLLAAAAALDVVDGAVARATGSVSAVGERLDVEVDSLIVLVGVALAVRHGGAPVAFLLVGLARYAFVLGIRLRTLRGLPARELHPSRRRRAVGALTMIVTWLVVLPVPDESTSWALAALATGPLLASFGRDWLVVTGRSGAPE